jgi:hypothetical protein
MIGQLKMNERLHGQHDPKLDVVRSLCITMPKYKKKNTLCITNF